MDTGPGTNMKYRKAGAVVANGTLWLHYSPSSGASVTQG